MREAVAIWDRLLIEVTRSVTAKLDKLGVYPVPLLLERGDFCMVRGRARLPRRAAPTPSGRFRVLPSASGCF